MTNEQKCEIIKSLSYGMSAEEVAEIEEVTVDVVEDIKRNCSAEIAERQLFNAEVGK